MANAVQDTYANAWKLTLEHPSAGTKYVASRELPNAGFANPFEKRIENPENISVIEQKSDFWSGVQIPTVSSPIEIGNADKEFDPTIDWTDIPATLEHYDEESDTTRTAWTGIVEDAWFRKDRLFVKLGSRAASVLDELLPSYVINTGDFPNAIDVGKAVPVVYGTNAPVKPPMIKHDKSSAETSAGGHDYLAGWGETISSVDRGPRLLKVYADSDLEKAGLELQSQWSTAPGSPAYATGSTFTVSGGGNDNHETVYQLAGLPIRGKTTASGSEYRYWTIKTFDKATGTVTIHETGELDAGLNSVEIASSYLAEYSRYTIGSRPVTNIRFFWQPPGGPLVVCQDSRGASGAAISNPASVIQDLFIDTDFGLSQSVNASSFSTGESDCSSAGLGSAVAGAVGWNGQQRRARDVFREISIMRGITVSHDASADEWSISVDKTPAAATVTLGNWGEYENIKDLVSYGTVPADEATRRIRLHYGLAGRSGPDARSFSESDFAYQMLSNEIVARGSVEDIFSPWIQNHTVAQKVTGYLAKRREHGNKRAVFAADNEARDVAVGNLVRVKLMLHDPDEGGGSSLDVDEDMQVFRREFRLNEVLLTCVGYDAEIFTYDGSDLTPQSDVSLDEDAPRSGAGANLILVPDFATGLRALDPASSLPDQDSVPGWLFQGSSPSNFGTIQIVKDYRAIGHHYIEIPISGTDADIASNAPRFTIANTTDGVFAGMPVTEDLLYFLSIYSELGTGWRWRVYFVDSSGLLITPVQRPILMRLAQTNGIAWPRYYSAMRAPTGAVRCYAETLFLTAQTNRFDAVKFEEAAKESGLPTEWNRTPRSGVDPSLIVAGDQTILADPDHPTAGKRTYHKTGQDTNLAGLSEVELPDSSGGVMLDGGRQCESASIAVVSNITFSGGGDGYSVGWKYGSITDENAFADHAVMADNGDAKLSAGDETNDGDGVSTLPIRVRGAGYKMIIKANNGGTFAGGTVRPFSRLSQMRSPTP